MDMDIRTISAEESDAFGEAVTSAFGEHPSPEEEKIHRLVFEPDRALAAFDGAQMVAGAAAVTMTLTVPGGSVPMAGVTAVGVRPTHRRRGLLTALMRRQLDDLREGGEAIAGLWASESSIYGRFGFGAATFGLEIELDRARAAFRPGPVASGRVTMVTREEAMAAMPPVFERLRPLRPGMLDRSEPWWQHIFADLESWRHGASAYFFVLHTSGADVDGYAVYRVKHDWLSSLPKGSIKVIELVAESPGAYADLWGYCSQIDLVETIEAWNRPVDDPLLHLLSDPRRLKARVTDSLYVRLVDVPRALASRRYATEGAVVLEVRDGFCPWNEGRFELVGGPDGASCAPSAKDPNLSIDAVDLGATFLGGVRFGQLVRAGVAGEDAPGAARRADALFGWDPPPWCPHIF
jgi:predicted acetyltransferase